MLNLSRVREMHPKFNSLSLSDKARLLGVSKATISAAEKYEEEQKHPERRDVGKYIHHLEVLTAQQSKVINRLIDSNDEKGVSYSPNLDNSTIHAQKASDIPAEGVCENLKRIWCIVGYDANGKPIERQVYGATQAKLADNIVKNYVKFGRIAEFVQTQPNQPPQTTAAHITKPFEEYAQYWFDTFCKGKNSNTYESATLSRLRTVKAYFGKKDIAAIKIADVQGFFDSRSDKKADTLKGDRSILKQIFESAMNDHLITETPMNDPRLKVKGGKRETDAFSVDETKHILQRVREAGTMQQKLQMFLLFFAGMRKEEALALKWEHVDFGNNYINICEAITYEGGKITKDPKSDAGVRSIPIADPLREVLQEGYTSKRSEFVLGIREGLNMNNVKWNNELKAVSALTGIHVTMQKTRRTYATLLESQNVDGRTLMTYMGHSSLDITYKHYIKPESGALNANRNAVTAALGV